MKQLIFLVVVFVALSSVAWWYFSTYSFHPYGPQTVPASAEATPAPPSKPAPVKSPPRIAPAAPEKPAESPAEPVPPPAPAVAEIRTAAPPQPSPQPPPPGALDNVRPGMPENQVVELLGQPTLSAMTSDRGRLDETYVYPRRIPGPFALIHMSDGRVVAGKP
jgi:cytoskeletal protein RodZ